MLDHNVLSGDSRHSHYPGHALSTDSRRLSFSCAFCISHVPIAGKKPKLFDDHAEFVLHKHHYKYTRCPLFAFVIIDDQRTWKEMGHEEH